MRATSPWPCYSLYSQRYYCSVAHMHTRARRTPQPYYCVTKCGAPQNHMPSSDASTYRAAPGRRSTRPSLQSNAVPCERAAPHRTARRMHQS